MNHQIQAGLFTPQQTEIPLLGVEITVDIQGQFSRVSITQKYKNQSSTAIEATYLFPVQDGSAIESFKAQSNGKEFHGKVMEREEAFDEYDEAIAEGHAAYLLDQERNNVLHASIGNLVPGQEVLVELSYYHPLEIVDAKSRLLIPTVVAPKYVPESMVQRYGMSEAERWNSPRVKEAPYTLNLSVNLSNVGKLISLESPSHPIKTKLSADSAQVELAQRSNTLDRDFILEFDLENKDHAYLSEDMNDKYISLLYHVPDVHEQKRSGQEVVFILDTSSSMAGSALNEAINALSLLLRQLDEQDYFNIIFFNSDYEQLWSSVQAYNQENLDLALKRLSQTYASGGTRLLSPLTALFNMPVRDGLNRQVVLLTDGAVSNEQELIQLCRHYRSEATIFTFGIGNCVSESLVKGIAKATDGSAEFIYSGERIEPKVLRVMKRLSASPYQLSVDWGTEVESQFDQARSVFGGDTVQVYAQLKPEQAIPGVIQIDLSGQKKELKLQSISSEQTQLGKALSALWARQRIEILESRINGDIGSLQDRSRHREIKKTRDERLKEEIISLAVKHQLMSQFTSFIAVEKRSSGDKIVGGMELKSTPLLASAPLLNAMSSFFGGSSKAVYNMSRLPVSYLLNSYSKQPDQFYSKQSDQVHKSQRLYNSFEPSSERIQSKRSSRSYKRKVASKLDQLLSLLNLQQANGLFYWSTDVEMMLAHLGISEEAKNSPAQFTTLVIKHIETEYQQHADLWGAALDKAKIRLQNTSA